MVSPNNSAAAIAHLLDSADAHQLIYHPKLAANAHAGVDLLAEKYPERTKCELIEEKLLPLWDVDWNAVQPFPRLFSPEEENKRIAFSLHTSGSTGFPKLVPSTQQAAVSKARVTHQFGDTSFTTLVCYHAHGALAVSRCYPQR